MQGDAGGRKTLLVRSVVVGRRRHIAAVAMAWTTLSVLGACRGTLDNAPFTYVDADVPDAFDTSVQDAPTDTAPPPFESGLFDAKKDVVGEASLIDAGPTPGMHLSAYWSTTCARFDTGKVKCWGDNQSGQLGIGDTLTRGDKPGQMGVNLPFVNLGAGRTARKVSVGASHVCALLDDGTVKCWGDNQSGQLGLGDNLQRSLPPLATVALKAPAVDVACGEGRSCAILQTGSVQCWGDNSDGRLGVGSTNSAIGAGAADMAGLPTVDLGAGVTVTKLSVGGRHTCVVTANGAVRCWGTNGNGQLGLGDTLARGASAAAMGANLPEVQLFAPADPAVAPAWGVAAGDFSTCAALADGRVKCWGENTFGQLGVGDTKGRGVLANEMGADLVAAKLDNNALALGVSGTALFECAWMTSGAAKCWGFNLLGQLGLGDTQHRGTDKASLSPLADVSLGSSVPPVVQIATGSAHACALFQDHRVKCWGSNPEGALGVGDTNARGRAPNQMGDALPFVELE